MTAVWSKLAIVSHIVHNKANSNADSKRVLSAGKMQVLTSMGNKTHWCHARENIQPVLSAGTHAARAKRTNKRGKTCIWCQARENMQLVPSAGKVAFGARRRKHWVHDVK